MVTLAFEMRSLFPTTCSPEEHAMVDIVPGQRNAHDHHEGLEDAKMHLLSELSKSMYSSKLRQGKEIHYINKKNYFNMTIYLKL